MVPISYPDQARALSRLSTPETPRARQSRGRWGSGRTEAGRPASRAAEIWKRGPGRAGAGRTLTGKETEPSVAKHQPWLDQLPFLVEMEWLGPSYPPARSGHKSGRHRVLKTLGIGRGQWSLKDGDQRCGRREAWGGVQRGDPSGAQKPPSGGRQGWASGAQVHSRSQSPELEARRGGRRRSAGPRWTAERRSVHRAREKGGPSRADAGWCAVQVPSARLGERRSHGTLGSVLRTGTNWPWTDLSSGPSKS